jgi:sporulation protein YlmC with PRC-barrel domain
MQTQSFANKTSTLPDGNALISGKTIQGTRVYSPAGDELGHIDDVMIDAASGKTVYGVLEFGGFLGLGSDHHAIPFGKLKYDHTRDGYVTDLTREQLDAAPQHDESWRENREWQKRSHDYYGVTPYWL